MAHPLRVLACNSAAFSARVLPLIVPLQHWCRTQASLRVGSRRLRDLQRISSACAEPAEAPTRLAPSHLLEPLTWCAKSGVGLRPLIQNLLPERF